MPSLELMERAGEGLARVIAQRAPAGRIAVVCGKGNNGGDGLRGRAAAARRPVARSTSWPCGRRRRSRATPPRCSSGCPGEPPEPFEAEPARRRARDRRRAARHRHHRRAARAGGRRDRGDQRRAARRWSPPTCRRGVDASTGEVAGPRSAPSPPRRSTAPSPGLWIHPGKAHAGAVEVIDIGIPRGAPGEPEIGLIGRGVLDDDAAPRRRIRPSSAPATCS